MLAALVVLGLGASGLDVTTETPDSLCPPLEATRQAVQARVGEVAGGPYRAVYTLVRDAELGVDSVRLVLTDGEGQMLLERLLPVPVGGCADLATAIALVLERHFQGMGGGAGEVGEDPHEASDAADAPPAPSAAPAARPDSVPAVGSPVAASPSAQQPPELRGTTPAPAWLRLRAGGGLNHDSSPLFTVGAEFRAAPWWNVGLDAALAVVPSRRSDRGYAFESSTHAFWLGSPFMVL
jgi:hypothetical protein